MVSKLIIGDSVKLRMIMLSALNEANLKEAAAKGLMVDNMDYYFIIRALCSKPDFGGACKLLIGMNKLGWALSEDVYTHILRACLKGKRLDEALRAKDEMVSNGKPLTTAMVASSLMKGCYKNQGMEHAYEFYLQLKLMGAKPDSFFMNSLISGFLKRGSWEEASMVFHAAVNSNVADVYTYTMFMSWFSDNRRFDMACGIWDAMVNSGIEPDRTAYGVLIYVFCRTNSMDLGLKILNEMRNKGMEPDCAMYTALMDMLCKIKNLGLALKMWNEMRDKDIEPDFRAYKALLGFCRNTNFTESAHVLLPLLFKVGMFPDAIVYRSMMRGFMDLNKFEAVLRLHKEMICHGIPCELQRYNKLIEIFLREGKIVAASELYDEMVGSKDLIANHATHRVLVNGICNKRQHKCAAVEMEKMEAKGARAGVLMYHTLIVGHFREGNLKEAFRLHDEMVERGVGVDDDGTAFDLLISRKVPL